MKHISIRNLIVLALAAGTWPLAAQTTAPASNAGAKPGEEEEVLVLSPFEASNSAASQQRMKPAEARVNRDDDWCDRDIPRNGKFVYTLGRSMANTSWQLGSEASRITYQPGSGGVAGIRCLAALRS